jgi:hypothetical protein
MSGTTHLVEKARTNDEGEVDHLGVIRRRGLVHWLCTGSRLRGRPAGRHLWEHGLATARTRRVAMPQYDNPANVAVVLKPDRRSSPEFAELMRQIKTGGTHASERRSVQSGDVARNEIALLQRVVTKQSKDIADMMLIITWALTRITALEEIETLSAFGAPTPNH